MGIYFDKTDQRLLEVINEVLDRRIDHAQFRTLLTPYLKPHGIKELAAVPGIRIAYAITHLIGSLESRQAQNRLTALAALKDEMLTAARVNMRNNRARVLIQIVKELVRARGDHTAQLKLAHDFNMVAGGKTHFLRKQLKKYHLLEMPEEWNQITFDDRVHDANSKGRKSATHLIMDAWIKGIKELRVVYYDVLDRGVAVELLSAARIMGIRVRIGIEYRAVFRGRFVNIIWDPVVLRDESDIDDFFNNPETLELMNQGQKAQEYRIRYIKDVIKIFNEVHRASIYQELGIELPPVSAEGLQRNVVAGQPSLLHLGKYIHEMALPLFRERMVDLTTPYAEAGYDQKAEIAMLVESLNAFDADTIIERYLAPEANPGLRNPDLPYLTEDVPQLLCIGPAELTARLKQALGGSRLSLILSDLQLEDVVEIVYDCKGAITDFELFNLKNITAEQVRCRKPICMFQQAINEQNTFAFKQIILDCMEAIRCSDNASSTDRLAHYTDILNHFEKLSVFYKHSRIRTLVGSGSTGISSRTPGMGFAVVMTLSPRSQRDLRKRKYAWRIPLVATVAQTVEFMPPARGKGHLDALLQKASRMRLLRHLLCSKIEGWHMAGFQVDDSCASEVASLGGIREEVDNGLRIYSEEEKSDSRLELRYLNSTLVNWIKVVVGFVPAFLTFFLTKEWWVLAYCGGLLWFGITCVRNIIQSVLGGGGFARSKYLRWNEYVSWNRISDSLLYTGFSVPLLDYFCKNLLLKQGLDITTTTAPMLLYAIMAIVNGAYISGHNIFRGLPKEIVAGNFFRSVFSIPVAIAFNWALSILLVTLGVTGIDMVLQTWAAVISKFASDFVAGLIEGLSDRKHNIAMRQWDYANKIKQVFETYTKLEILFPTIRIVDAMKNPAEFCAILRTRDENYIHILMVNALDLLYFKMYQPRASEAFLQVIKTMSHDEKDILYSSQLILDEERDIARLFVDGLVGQDFTRPLTCYLLNYRTYLEELKEIFSV
ncbi:hypothetical protein [Desulfovibrio inopinatus]|uniref:hypothetical protein n=1 Tax=Desulfovibrio inopinatus TaxID=102109 RepID=UPI0003F5D3AA|nr:hypothetical protein [Desulfovibrio inopinatus]